MYMSTYLDMVECCTLVTPHKFLNNSCHQTEVKDLNRIACVIEPLHHKSCYKLSSWSMG